jgi:hypothetical protein
MMTGSARIASMLLALALASPLLALEGCDMRASSGAVAGSPTPAPSGSATPTASPSGSASPSSTPGVSATGGSLDVLDFGITGDTRPAVRDDTAGYPSGIITKIFQDLDAESPRVFFTLTLGDYNNADTSFSEAAPQIDAYLAARASYTGTVFYAQGNHECKTHDDTGNCGDGAVDGWPTNYSLFMSKLIQPMGFVKPYYGFDVSSTSGAWTAKFLVVAGNSWTTDQAAWLEQEMSRPTTYTFVIRHQDTTATEAPGVSPSAAILAAHPYTLLLVAHQHQFRYDAALKQVVTGNGGAPLDTGANYGYTVVRQQPDGSILGTNFDYQSHAVIGTFHVAANGAPL